mgnify:FL=1
MVKCPPKCGNTSKFMEVLNGCCLEVTYEKSADGEWFKEESEVNPDVEYNLIFECANCQHDCTDYHSKFLGEYKG